MPSDYELRREARDLSRAIRTAAEGVPESTAELFFQAFEGFQALPNKTMPAELTVPATSKSEWSGFSSKKSNAELSALFRDRVEQLQANLLKRGVPIALQWPGANLLIDGNDLRTLASAIERSVKELGSHIGYVAFVDLLGFSRRVALGAPDEFFLAYQEALSKALDADRTVRYVVSSDSIVIYASSTDEEGLVAICNATGRLFYELTLIHVGIRGAISYGRFRETRTDQGTIIAGPPILEAVEYEKLQDWVGVMLAPSVVEKNLHLAKYVNLRAEKGNDSTGKRIIRAWDIPFKTDRPNANYEGFALLPVHKPGAKDSAEDALKCVSVALNQMYRFAPDPGAQGKYRKAIEFVNEAKRSL